MKLKDNMFLIQGWHNDGDTTAADISLQPDHIIYQAHFPGQPVTPGVCILQIISELAEEHLHTTLALTLVKSMKFIKPLSPVEDAEVTVRFQQLTNTDGIVTAKGDITKGDTLYTKFSLIYHDEG